METLSVIIITKNAAATIERCLKSVKWANEIIILDSNSNDNTIQICKKYTQNVHSSNDWPGFGAQKNRALSLATQSFVLSIDADEWLTETLQQEIQAVLKQPKVDGYYLKRHNIYWGRILKYGNDGPEYLLRLFKRSRGKFTDVSVHERVVVDGAKAKLANALLHEPYTSIKSWLDKMNRYSSLSAKQKLQAGKRTYLLQMFYKSFWFFVRGYFLKLGILDGKSGLICAFLNGISTYFRYLKMYIAQTSSLRGNRSPRDFVARDNVKKYLISRTDNIGDVILTLPLAGLLKQNDPSCEVWFLARNHVKDILSCANNVDGFISVDDNNPDISGFNIFLNVDARYHSAKLAKKAKIKTRIGTSHRLYHWWTCNKLVNFNRKKSSLHEAQLNTKLLKPLGFNKNYSLAELAQYLELTAPASIKINPWLDTEKFNLVCHPGSNGNTREWPIDHWKTLIETLPQDQFHIFITGTEKENERFKMLSKIKQPNVTHLMGKCSLMELTSLLAHCDGVVVGSTGPLHIAAALGVHTLGLFPPFQTANPKRWGPIGKQAEFLVYSNNCEAKCINQHCACMQNITVNQVATKILAWQKATF